MQDPDFREGYLATANTKPSLLLKGEKPRLIDEWQEAPVLWDAVRTAVDNENKDGLFILTGSVNVDETKIHHSGTGRISRLKMYPMSLYESNESNGKISLKELFDEPDKDIDGVESNLEIEDLIFAACRGGWPGSLFKSSREGSLFVAKDYFINLCENDISSVDGVKRNPAWTQAILYSYARNISTLAKTTNLLKDLKEKLNLTILFISHDLGVVKYLCDRIAVMYLGDIVELADSKSLFEETKHPYTKALISAVPSIHEKKTQEIKLEGDLPSPKNPPKGCRFNTRCAYVQEICSQKEPAITKISDSHCVRCFLYE